MRTAVLLTGTACVDKALVREDLDQTVMECVAKALEREGQVPMDTA